MQKSDQFEARLEAIISKLRLCQQEKKLQSCLKCKEIIGCALRKEYVQITYESMSKGEIGGFEF